MNPEQTVSSAEMERMMKVQEVILKAMAGSLKWWEAAEIIGVSDRTMRRWRERYEEGGYDGLYDYRKGRPSPKREPLRGPDHRTRSATGPTRVRQRLRGAHPASECPSRCGATVGRDSR